MGYISETLFHNILLNDVHDWWVCVQPLERAHEFAVKACHERVRVINHNRFHVTHALSHFKCINEKAPPTADRELGIKRYCSRFECRSEANVDAAK